MKMITFAPVALAVLALSGCSPAAKPPAPKPETPAKVENRVTESDLTRIVLSKQAEQRLGIETVAVAESSAIKQVTIIGDIQAIPGRSIIVSAPASGVVSRFRQSLTPGMTLHAGQELFHLTPMVAAQRDLRLTFEADLQSAKARFDNATRQASRARQLLRDMAGSQRNVDTAEQEFAQAKAAFEAATQRMKRLETNPLDADVDMAVTTPVGGILRQVQVAQGQTVNAGAPLFEVVDYSKVWLRVPVYAADLKNFNGLDVIRIRDVDGQGESFAGRRAIAPPTADPVAVTSDIYYEIENRDNRLRPGQRMSAELPTRSQTSSAAAVPTSAILYDIHGGTWVYESEGKSSYRRRRVEILHTNGNLVLLARGVSAGMLVVSQGAAELFGTEFGAGH